jgi:hypothetical protein
MESVVYILLEDKEEVIALNETGSIIWNHVRENPTVADLLTAVLDEFAGDEQTIKNSVIDFLEELSKIGALKICSQNEREVTND